VTLIPYEALLIPCGQHLLEMLLDEPLILRVLAHGKSEPLMRLRSHSKNGFKGARNESSVGESHSITDGSAIAIT
jgi:hypothetical protein